MAVPPLLSHRLSLQGLAAPAPVDPVAALTHMVALQAQDGAMALWALGMRTGGANKASIEAALNDGRILRTHLLRPTWHLVAASDVRWLLRLSAPQVRQAMAFMNRHLGLEPAHFTRSRKVFEKTLAAGPCTRAELKAQMDAARISTDETRMAHLLMDAELQGQICSGPRRGAQLTYALLDQRVPHHEAGPEGLEAAVLLARRYFQSRGPATLADFTWWSALPVSLARKALAVLEKELQPWPSNPHLLHFPATSLVPPLPVLLLPAFDEYLIAYRDRSALLAEEHRAPVITSNGIFRPVVTVKGRVTATWRAETGRSGVRISIQLLPGAKPIPQRALATALRAYSDFLQMPVRHDA
ncbi:MAG: winged helix DNA-binding domain-containing protein [Chitinophagaceae bacterium]|nr:MAG: winged helix DNA-binding domain-containing protein [Chitinophagaceae bacterium]